MLARIETVLLPHDYLTYRLTGRYVTDRGDASGTGYWSPFEERWRPDLLDRVRRRARASTGGQPGSRGCSGRPSPRTG